MTAKQSDATNGIAANSRSVEEMFYDAFFTNAAEGIFIIDTRGRLLSSNKAYSEKVGAESANTIGRVPFFIKPTMSSGVGFYRKVMRSLKRKGSWKGEVAFRRDDGLMRLEWLSIQSSKNTNGDTTSYIGTIIDSNEQGENTLNKHYYDQLTKLPNRLLLQDRLEFMINLARRNGKLMALLLLDIDRFKLINDTFGYEAGDTLLKTIAERLYICVRDVDAVFRSGDDEFAVILEEIAHEEDAAKVAQRILELCAGPQEIDKHDIHVSVCIGISVFPTDGNNKSQILQCAEAAMHRAREAGFNNYQHYKPSMNTKAIERLSLENDLRNALAHEELFTLFQPQVKTGSGQIIGAEALIRWRHPTFGVLPPNRFIPIAEDFGLILPIGEWVLQSACMQARKWQRSGLPVVISVNLSAYQLNQQNIVPIVENALKNSNVMPNMLELEITETMSMKNPEDTLKTLSNLKSLGVKIAIDDFGTGYSSLSYLNRFPIDTLKIDKSFLANIPNNPRDMEIVKAVIAMAHSLNLSVIAEGVETEAQRQYLLDNGCEKMQGYLISPPIPAYEFDRLLLRQMASASVNA